MDEALKCKESGEAKVIVFNNSGHGHFDLSAYERYLSGKLEDYELPEAEIRGRWGSCPRSTPESSFSIVERYVHAASRRGGMLFTLALLGR